VADHKYFSDISGINLNVKVLCYFIAHVLSGLGAAVDSQEGAFFLYAMAELRCLEKK